MDERTTLVRQALGHVCDVAAEGGDHADEFRARIDDEVSRCFRDHAAYVVASVAWRYGDAEESHDVTQEAFLRLHQTLLNGGSVQDPRKWVSTVARNLMRDRLKAARYRPTISDLSSRDLARVMTQPATLPSPEDTMNRRQRNALLRQGVPTLTPMERRCLHGRSRGLTLREIGDRLQMDFHRVHDTIARAISKLRRQIGE